MLKSLFALFVAIVDFIIFLMMIGAAFDGEYDRAAFLCSIQILSAVYYFNSPYAIKPVG